MLQITNVLHLDGSRKDLVFNSVSPNDIKLDGSKLLALPQMIDPHVHFRTPGMEHKEDWVTGSRAAFAGGYGYVFDMPNTIPTTTTKDRLLSKIDLINSQIVLSGLPLQYKLFFGADKNNFDQISLVKDSIAGIKVFMGASTGELLMDDESSLHAVYAIAAKFNLIIALHAEDELIIQERSQLYKDETDFKYHSIIRDRTAAIKAVSLVIKLSKLYGVKSYILHLSTKEEIDLVRQAKLDGISVYAETCAHYLFLDDSDYAKLNGFAKMNPPLRTRADQDYLWSALNDGTIDTIASDHAPHTLDEKNKPLCKCPSGIPGIETTLPLLLSAYKQGKISLTKIVELTHTNPSKLFNLPATNDIALVNIEDYEVLSNDKLQTKVKWSPYADMSLTGYPRYMVVNDLVYDLDTFSCI